jgi:hypothetical protein
MPPQLPPRAAHARSGDDSVSFWEHVSPEVAQAIGMVSAQAGCSAAEAMALIRDRARVQNRTLDEIAAGVLDRSIRFAI